jgi:hypothetical protein
MNSKPKTVEEYIKQFPKSTQTLLKQVRAVIRHCARSRRTNRIWNARV